MTQPYKINQTTVKDLDTALATKQDKLTAGDGITITDNVISATASGPSLDISTQDQAYEGKDDTTAMSPLKVASVAGRVTQLGFDGVLENNVITFTHATSYAINDGYEYEFDLLFPASGTLDDSYTMVVTNNGDNYVLANALDPSYNNNMTVGNMKQVQSYDPEVGFKWSFKAIAKTSSTGVKILYMTPVVVKIDEIKTLEDKVLMAESDIEQLETTTSSLTSRVTALNTAIVNKANTVDVVTLADSQTISGAKCFTNDASSVASDAHTGMSLTLKNTEATIGETDSKYYYQGLRVVDKNNEEIGAYYVSPDGSGGTATYLMASTKVGEEYKDASLTLGVDKNGNPYNAVATPAKTDNSARIATTKYVKDNLGDYVTLASNDVIGGIKTFNNVINTSQYGTRTKTTSTKGTAPTSNQTWLYNVAYDNGGLAQANKFAQTYTAYPTDGNTLYSAIQVFKPESGSTESTSFRVGYDSNGVAYASCPTPSNLGANDTKIATTQWVSQKFQVVSALPATPDTNVFYFIPE